VTSTPQALWRSKEVQDVEYGAAWQFRLWEEFDNTGHGGVCMAVD